MNRSLDKPVVISAATKLATRATILAAALILVASAGYALADGEHDEAMEASVGQLRSVVGQWDVVTEFLNDDGSVARTVNGSYEFSWVVPDRVLSGKSEMPELKQMSAILLYINPARREIEMASVGADGRLWVMTGPLGGETRTTEEFKTADGGTGQLRFTRFNVSADAFESKMEYSGDGGKTWQPGNHQSFERIKSSAQ